MYLLILGGRYGSIEPKTGKSYIHLEYEYALSRGKPAFACVIKDGVIEVRVKAEGTGVIELENPQKLKAFRAEVLTRLCKFWEDSKDIKITITETLSHLAKRENLVGWVRPDTQSNLPAITDEITRLSKENAQLRNQIANAVREDNLSGLGFSEMKTVLERLNLLDFFVKNRQKLAAGYNWMMHGGQEEVQELLIRGLVEHHGGRLVHLSDSGRVFLNRLEALRFSIQAESQPVIEKPKV